MREIGRQRRLRGRAAIGLAAMVALGVGGSLVAGQASAAPRAHAAADVMSPQMGLRRGWVVPVARPPRGLRRRAL